MAGEDKPLRRLRRKLTVETLWLYVLAVLSEHGPTYAYNVKRLIQRTFGFKPSTATLYTVIYRLERGGYLENVGGEYSVTSKGTQLLREGIEFLENTLITLKNLAGGSNGP